MSKAEQLLRDFYAAYGRRDLSAMRAFLTDRPELEWDMNDQIVMVVHHNARGRSSGVMTHRREVHLWTIRDGLPVRMQEFQTKDEALES